MMRIAVARKYIALCLITMGMSIATVTYAADESATNKQPVKAVGEQRIEVKTATGRGVLAVYASRDWSKPGTQADITRAVLVFHGRLRNADVYWDSAEKAAAAAGEVGQHTLLIVPQFLAQRDVDAYQLPPETLRWSLEGWMGGDTALAPAAISSFEAIDAILTQLADRKRFPNLTQVVVAGHSGGAQVVQRYAVVGQGENSLKAIGVHVRYVVANPSSYLYFNDERPLPDGSQAPFSAAACPDFNQWKYGWSSAPAYATQHSAAEYEQTYSKRDVIYLLGTADTNPNHPALDKSCAAEAQGPYRLARGKAYLRYLHGRHQDLAHRQWDVPGVGHDGDRMMNSACGLSALFDLASASEKCQSK